MQDISNELLTSINNLTEELQTEEPQIESSLLDILENLQAFPDVVVLLDDTQIAAIYRGIMVQNNTEVTKKKRAKRKGALTTGETLSELLLGGGK